MPSLLPSLLLLPPPPVPTTPAAITAAYRPSINAIVSTLKDLAYSSELLIVVPCPSLRDRLEGPRAGVYTELQHLLSGLYSLVCTVCATLGVDVESGTPGSIDTRIVFLDGNGSPPRSTGHPSAVAGPIIDLHTLAMTRRQWNLIFSVDGEAGQKLFAEFSGLANQHSPPLSGHVHIISGGVSLIQKGPVSRENELASSTRHSVVAVGGTFDHLHAGHKLLLTATALLLQPASSAPSVSRRLIVGITGEELLKNKKYPEFLNSWQQRQEDVVEFLLSIISFTSSSPAEAIQTLSFNQPGPNGRAIHTKLRDHSITIECVEIQDPFGPTITDESVTALVLSGETRSGGQAVNDRRIGKGWKALEVFEIDVLESREPDEAAGETEGFSSKISSTEIRKRRAENSHTSSL